MLFITNHQGTANEKATRRDHPTPVRTAHPRGKWRKRSPGALLVQAPTGHPLCSGPEGPQRLRNPVWPSNSTTGDFLKGQRKQNSQDVEAYQEASRRGVGEAVAMYKILHVAVYQCIHLTLYSIFRHKKERNLTMYNMDGPRGYNGKWNTSEKDKYRLVSLTWNLKWTRKETNKNPPTLQDRQQTGGCRGGSGRSRGGWIR